MLTTFSCCFMKNVSCFMFEVSRCFSLPDWEGQSFKFQVSGVKKAIRFKTDGFVDIPS